jgi:toxin HigB-1
MHQLRYRKTALKALMKLPADARQRIQEARNRLEALAGDRESQHSIRVNDQWRIFFVWQDDGAHAVEIVDDH